MNERIDVLAVIDSVIRYCGLSVVFGRDVREARAAVAELIEYANSARIVLANAKTMSERDIQMAHDGLAAALARVGAA